MNIATSYAQIIVKDSDGLCGANISSIASGYVSDLYFWGKTVYVARRTGESLLHIIIAPSDCWMDDIKAEGFEVIGKLSDLVNAIAMTPATLESEPKKNDVAG